MKLQTKYERHGLSSFRQDFYVKKNIPFHKKGQGQHKVIIFSNFIRPMSPISHAKPQAHWPFGSGEEDY